MLIINFYNLITNDHQHYHQTKVSFSKVFQKQLYQSAKDHEYHNANSIQWWAESVLYLVTTHRLVWLEILSKMNNKYIIE